MNFYFQITKLFLFFALLTNLIIKALSVSITEESDLTCWWSDTLEFQTNVVVGALLLFVVQIVEESSFVVIVVLST